VKIEDEREESFRSAHVRHAMNVSNKDGDALLISVCFTERESCLPCCFFHDSVFGQLH
jgi:hypothetical protein